MVGGIVRVTCGLEIEGMEIFALAVVIDAHHV